MWDQGTLGRAHQAEPVIIVLQDLPWFPNRKQYPLKREAKEGLQPLINKFLACGLLVPTSSPCSTLILSVMKKDGAWRMARDLQIINEAVVPLHPTVPNPYVILGEIPPRAKWFTVLDLKDAFFFLHTTGSRIPISFCLQGGVSRRKTPTDDLDSITSGVQRQPPLVWTGP